jgi:TolA-binding protein
MTLQFQAGEVSLRLCQRTTFWVGIAGIFLSTAVFAQEQPVSNSKLYPAGTLSLATYTNQPEPSPSVTSLQDILNGAASKSGAADPTAKPPSNAVPAAIASSFNKSLPGDVASVREVLAEGKRKFETARYLRVTRQPREAEALLVELLGDNPPEFIQQSALLELAAAAQDQNDLPRAEQIYAQFQSKWSGDLRVPEILLREGLLYRQMGLNNLALAKFYGVMTGALVLKSDQLDYYARLVNQAQLEIAETHYQLGKYSEAADFFSRLLRQTNSINKSPILYKLVRCQTSLGQYTDAVSTAREFLAQYPRAPEQPEIRFHLALSLKQLGRDNDSLQQVLILLQEQRATNQDRPEVWAWWQQRAGNLIANHLYHEGDYARALEIYLNLTQLDRSPEWQLPIKYQVAMTYERLGQPQKAAETYADILSNEPQSEASASPGMKAIFDMARWRNGFIDWQNKAENANGQLNATSPGNSSVTASLPASSTIP